MLQDDRVRLQHMLDAVFEVVKFRLDKECSGLDDDRKLKHALVRLLKIIGKAATGMSSSGSPPF